MMNDNEYESPGGLRWVRWSVWEAHVGPFSLYVWEDEAGRWGGQLCSTTRGRTVATVRADSFESAIAQVEAAALLARADQVRAAGGGETPAERWSVGDLLWTRRPGEGAGETWQTYLPGGTRLQVWSVGRWAWAGDAHDAGGRCIARVVPHDTWSDAVTALERIALEEASAAEPHGRPAPAPAGARPLGGGGARAGAGQRRMGGGGDAHGRTPRSPRGGGGDRPPPLV